MLNEQIDKDLKTALLARDSQKVNVLKGLKNALQYEAKAVGLDEAKVQTVLAREAKKRTEAADIYTKAGETVRAEAELAEKAIIEAYLPEQASESDVQKAVDEELAKSPGASSTDMGRIIGAVRARFDGQADGALIARLVKEKING